MKRHMFMTGFTRILVALGLVSSCGCATLVPGKAVQPGDRVLVHVTCRLNDGKVVYTSLKDTDLEKSHAFFERKTEGPVEMVAGKGYDGPMHGRLKCFEPELMACLSTQITGMTLHETKQVTLETTEPPDLTDEDRFLTLSRKRRQPRVSQVGRIPFVNQTGKEPAPGVTGPGFGPLSTVVRSVDKDQVAVELLFKDGDIMDTPFGPGILQKDGDEYTIIIDARVGYPVKTPPLLGQIIRVDDDNFVVDYGHPFGSQALACDLEIMAINPAAQGETP
ncbi:MAG: FKBP-type peptidyl-prolyl cis-trans isomerase [Proteobacteria bacterium]|nr:FKBP-type peptidyl-prolyl cis-trans isomerase [Pseudomonadota bacterium]